MTRHHLAVAVLSIAVIATEGAAQGRRPTVPVVVAEAMNIIPLPGAKPQYYDGRVPDGWPAALVPHDAAVIGGGRLGDPGVFRVRAAVFEFPPGSNPAERVRELLDREGFTRVSATGRGAGGFVASDHDDAGITYCRESVIAGFTLVDSAVSSPTVTLHLIDGEPGHQTCGRRSDTSGAPGNPVAVPTLVPLPGSRTQNVGSSWSETRGSLRAMLDATAPVDSVIAHYAAQLVAAGWSAEGAPAANATVGAQRFAFRSGDEPWMAALFVVAAGDRQQLILELVRNHPGNEY